MDSPNTYEQIHLEQRPDDPKMQSKLCNPASNQTSTTLKLCLGLLGVGFLISLISLGVAVAALATVRDLKLVVQEQAELIHKQDLEIQKQGLTLQCLKNKEPNKQDKNVKQEVTGTPPVIPTTPSTLGGAVYVRWGRESCQPNATELVYKGFIGGQEHQHTGGGSNYVCLSAQPQRQDQSLYTSGSKTLIYGAEYEFNLKSDGALHENDAPCAVCRSLVAPSVVMIPGRKQCYPGWGEEYTGTLVSEHYTHKGRLEFVCLDMEPQAILGGNTNNNGALLYPVTASCGSLKCPPYVQGEVLPCVVCTK